MTSFRPCHLAEFERAGLDCSGAVSFEAVATAAGPARSTPHGAVAYAEAARRTGRVPEARQALATATQQFIDLRDASGQAWSLWVLGSLLRQTGWLADSIVVLAASHARARYAEDEVGCSYAFAGIAESWRARGAFDLAWPAHVRALRTFERLGDGRGVVWALEGLGQMCRLGSRIEVSGRYFAEARRVADAVGDLRGLGYAWKGLGEAASSTGLHRRAVDHLGEAIQLLDQFGGHSGAGYGHKALGDAWRRNGELDAADGEYLVALRLFSQASDLRGRAWVVDAQGDTARARGDRAAAVACYREAYRGFSSLGVMAGLRTTAASLSQLGASLPDGAGVQRGARSVAAMGDDTHDILTAYTRLASR